MYTFAPRVSIWGAAESKNLSAKGIMLVRIPAGCFSFLENRLYMPYRFPSHQRFSEDLGLFVWRSREYLEKYPPLKDVE